MRVVTVEVNHYADREIVLGSVAVGLHSMVGEDGGGPAVAFTFSGGGPAGLSVEFQASTAQVRAFAAELIRHADAAEAAAQRLAREVA